MYISSQCLYPGLDTDIPIPWDLSRTPKCLAFSNFKILFLNFTQSDESSCKFHHGLGL